MDNFTLKIRETGKHIPIEEYFDSLYKSFTDVFFGKKVTSDDIELWCDDSLDAVPCMNYEEIEFATPERSRYDEVYSKFRQTYITKCRLAFKIFK